MNIELYKACDAANGHNARLALAATRAMRMGRRTIRQATSPTFCHGLHAETKLMLADPMTKPVDLSTLQRFCEIVFNSKHRFL